MKTPIAILTAAFSAALLLAEQHAPAVIFSEGALLMFSASRISFSCAGYSRHFRIVIASALLVASPLQITYAVNTPVVVGNGISVDYRIGTGPTVTLQYDAPYRTYDSGYYAPRPYHYLYYSDPGYYYYRRVPRMAVRSGWQALPKSVGDKNQKRTYQPSTQPPI